MIDNESETKTLKLEMIPCPAHYFCDQLNFEQPDYMTWEQLHFDKLDLTTGDIDNSIYKIKGFRDVFQKFFKQFSLLKIASL